MDELRTVYGRYVKPGLARLMETLRLDKNYERGVGDNLYYRNPNGEEIGVLDLAGGMGASLFGHNNTELSEEKRKCIDEEVPMNAQASAREDAGRLAEMLSRLYPGKEPRYSIFTNSGTEAVEGALKHAEMNRMKRIQALWKEIFRNHNEVKEYCRLHSNVRLPREYAEKGIELLLGEILDQGRRLMMLLPVVISTERSFHGKTTSAVRITGNPMYREAFMRLSAIDARFIEYNSVKDLEKTIKESYETFYKIEISNGKLKLVEIPFLNICAFIMEPVQGEGGVHVATREFMAGVEKLKKKYGFEWIMDEIQTGMGRTGKLFAVEHYNINPDSVDYVLLSKALGGGMAKIGAAMVRRSIHDPNFGILHTSTFAEDSES
ncbi:MAG: aminotransferase class III-fold pyridoxal phosphate-dependent enzyme, partial [bacterium]